MPQINILSLFQLIRENIINLWLLVAGIGPSIPKIIFWYKIGAYIFIIIGTAFAAYFVYQILAIRRKESEKLSLSNINVIDEATKPINPRWQNILAKMQSDNINDWKLAIIEADTILDEMVKRMGYPGDNLGERLKAVEPSDFLTLNEAWEAHKVRNQIAFQQKIRIFIYNSKYNGLGWIKRICDE